MTKEIKLVAKVSEVEEWNVNFDFGNTQADFWIYAKGKHQKALELKKGDSVEITVKKIEK